MTWHTATIVLAAAVVLALLAAGAMYARALGRAGGISCATYAAGGLAVALAAFAVGVGAVPRVQDGSIVAVASVALAALATGQLVPVGLFGAGRTVVVRRLRALGVATVVTLAADVLLVAGARMSVPGGEATALGAQGAALAAIAATFLPVLRRRVVVGRAGAGQASPCIIAVAMLAGIGAVALLLTEAAWEVELAVVGGAVALVAFGPGRDCMRRGIAPAGSRAQPLPESRVYAEVHDLRGHLASIGLAAHALEGDLRQQRDPEVNLQRLGGAVSAARILVGSILEDSLRPALGHGADLDAAAQTVIPSLVAAAAGRIVVEEDLRPARTRAVAPADAAQLVLNLGKNACEWCRDGGRVLVRTHERNGFAVLSVSDEGDWIDDRHLVTLFDRDIAVRDGEPHGLGLAIVVRTCLAAGGLLSATADGGCLTVEALLPTKGESRPWRR